MVEKRFYMIEEAAEMLGLSVEELNDKAKKGEIRGFRDTAGFKFKVELIDELVASGEYTSATPAAAEASDDLMPLDDDDDLVELDANDAVDLDGDVLEDDDLVLGGSGTGSGITLGGDSGISLVDPADSGLLLEEPLDLGGSDVESLTLGEVDDLGFDDGEIAGTSGISGADEEFLLEPASDLDDFDESESGSQVIPLDVDGDDEAATMVGGAFEEDGFATLEDDAEFADATELPQAEGGQYVDPEILAALEEAQLDEKPYSAGVVTGLVLCVIPMIICGLFAVDLMRSMWSWDTPMSINSDMMDTVLGWFQSSGP